MSGHRLEGRVMRFSLLYSVVVHIALNIVFRLMVTRLAALYLLFVGLKSVHIQNELFSYFEKIIQIFKAITCFSKISYFWVTNKNKF